MPDTSALSDKSPEKAIVLVGLMGAGKSTVGRRLAARLGRPFFDADAEIETAAGMTIAEIFERFGEAHFRDGERRVMARLIDGPAGVIATGGGAFADDATRALILERGVAVWLDADIATLAERVGRRDHRPLLKDRDAAEVLSELAGRRNAAYAEAHVTVRSGRGSIEKTVDAILAALAGHAH
ncbi:shikimate kinase [Sphingosinicella sp. LHD-64]|uniref:shikimate kinase n=1 Tax=Sphingosinicella sp. LHD-64 TaxID=3072139 RepID=UPI00280D1638|nr:shikimate kinase [Sphingosinicella sp. LHD-64]MDQ8754892.1 shikimate kinase [Sphingosinicella sp. LHD-64]